MLPSNVEHYASAPWMRETHHAYALGETRVVLVEPICCPPRPGEHQDAQKKRQLAWILWARDLEARGRKVAAVVLTHYHEDHTIGVGPVAHSLGVPVLGPHELGDAIEGWHVVRTPGHARDHVGLFDGHTFVAGDLLELDADTRSAPFLRSLDLVADMDPELVLTAHTHPIEERTFARYCAWRLGQSAARRSHEFGR
jgi:glyoxylase-like metal-dependent hydrolase (beta-lactamase superfamily II)